MSPKPQAFLFMKNKNTTWYLHGRPANMLNKASFDLIFLNDKTNLFCLMIKQLIKPSMRGMQWMLNKLCRRMSTGVTKNSCKIILKKYHKFCIFCDQTLHWDCIFWNKNYHFVQKQNNSLKWECTFPIFHNFCIESFYLCFITCTKNMSW